MIFLTKRENGCVIQIGMEFKFDFTKNNYLHLNYYRIDFKHEDSLIPEK